MVGEKTMTAQEIANRMSELFKENKWAEVQDELFSEDCESVEPAHAMGMKTVRGKAAIKQKGEEEVSIVTNNGNKRIISSIMLSTLIQRDLKKDKSLKISI